MAERNRDYVSHTVGFGKAKSTLLSDEQLNELVPKNVKKLYMKSQNCYTASSVRAPRTNHNHKVKAFLKNTRTGDELELPDDDLDFHGTL